MGLQNLRDKLIAAGVVSAEQARQPQQTKQARHADQDNSRKRPGPSVEPRAPSREERVAAEERAAFEEHARFLGQERADNRKRALIDRERQAKIRAIAEEHAIQERGETPFHFASRKKRILRLHLTPEVIRQLESGALAIIEHPTPAETTYAVVPRACAEQALSVDPKAVRFYNRDGKEAIGFVSEQDIATKAKENADETTEAARDIPKPDANT